MDWDEMAKKTEEINHNALRLASLVELPPGSRIEYNGRLCIYSSNP
ncbi:hypothetical protein LCGC14_1514700 [marine sediment metagenome]|uniref:Uncharacterized protein n=1 Tax=marine sediment metagenome TaxID=412755 RepID=A0A0F9J0H5_9ZZZZ